MLDNFRKIYNKELKRCEHDGVLTRMILNTTEVRAFVYEVCKACVASQSTTSADVVKTLCNIKKKYKKAYFGLH